ncbi:replication protein A 70 kDa DNA-binding subunit B-like [Quercus suber]|uniref:replication protein A 70 kDa DNA-binding subunit B-like n=1 Tax=Quercus suber TaxID=58331 RepID=UPI0032DED38B
MHALHVFRCIFVNTEQSVVLTNPDLPEAKKLRSCSGMSPSSKSGSRSMYSDRVSLSHILKNPSLGEENVLYQELFTPVFFSIRGYISFIKPAQATWYRACKTCNKKVTEALGFGYWCEACHKNDEECNLS